MLKSASFVDFLFHWVEWLNTAALGTGGVLAADIEGLF